MDTTSNADSPVGDDRIEQLGRLADLVLRTARKIEAHRLQDPRITPLTALESMVLRHVDDHPGTSPARVAEELVMKVSNVSAGLRGLEQKGLVAKAPDPHDARHVRLSVTDAARDSTIRVRAEWGRLLGAALPPDAEISGAVRLLTDLETGLG
jgi:DNA-binding MarR family transcriptional regulator